MFRTVLTHVAFYISIFKNAARYEAKELELWVEPTLEEMDEMEAELMEEAEEDLVGEFLEGEFEEEGESGDDIDEDMLIEEEEEEAVVVPVVVKKGRKKNEKAKPAVKPNGALKGKKKQGNGISAAEEKKRPAKKARK